MGFKEDISTLTGNKRKFMLLRVADMDADVARKICGISQGVYNGWLNKDKHFVQLYHKRNEWSREHKKDALRMLHVDNQLSAVFLVEKILEKMEQQIAEDNYDLARSAVGRSIIDKLITGLDEAPQVQSLTWADKIQQLFIGKQEVEVIDGQYEAITFQENEPQESQLISQGKQELTQS